MYVFLDETGDTGFKFPAGSSRFFIVALVLADEDSAVTQAAASVRQRFGWPADREFKFSGTHHDGRIAYLQAIQRCRFNVHCMVFDKERLGRVEPRVRNEFYGHLVSLALDDVVELVSGAHLVLDESFKGKSKKASFRSYLRSELSAPGRRSVLRNVSYRASHTDDMLQLADMVVGAVGRTQKTGDNEYQRLVERRIRSTRVYP